MPTRDYTIPDIEGVLQKLDGQVKNVTITRLTAPGENFLSLVFKVDVEVLKNGSTKTVSTVAKRLPLGIQEMNMNAMAMRNEIKWYSEVLPFLKTFAQENDIDCSFYPEYVGSRFSLDKGKQECDSEAVLVLDNLIPQGFKNEDRYVGFDLTSAKPLLRALATFHATPLVMKYKSPELFQKLADFLESSKPSMPPKMDKNDKAGPGGPDGKPPKEPPFKDLFNKLVDFPEMRKYRDTVLKLKNKPMGKPSWIDDNGKEPWITVGHNDYWVNNMMLKKVEGDEPMVKIVDFQFGTYISYAKDLVFFLLTSVMDAVQRKHIDGLLRYYYNEFTAILKKANSPKLELSYEEYLKEVKRVAEAELEHAIFFSNIIFGPKNGQIDVLAGEGTMEDHLKTMMQNVSPRHIEKLVTIFDVATKQGWI